MLEIKDVIKDTGWDWDQIPFDLPTDTKMMIQATPLSLTGRGSDKLTWARNPIRNFDLKSAYSIAMDAVSDSLFLPIGFGKPKLCLMLRLFFACVHTIVLE